jgi:hypothetical protein
MAQTASRLQLERVADSSLVVMDGFEAEMHE